MPIREKSAYRRRLGRLCLLLVLVLCLEPCSAIAITGNQWRQYSEDAKGFYLTGLFDAWNFSDALQDASGKVILSSVKPCLGNMTYDQLIAILDKYMKEHPERWNQQLTLILLPALGGACQGQ